MGHLRWDEMAMPNLVRWRPFSERGHVSQVSVPSNPSQAPSDYIHNIVLGSSASKDQPTTINAKSDDGIKRDEDLFNDFLIQFSFLVETSDHRGTKRVHCRRWCCTFCADFAEYRLSNNETHRCFPDLFMHTCRT